MSFDQAYIEDIAKRLEKGDRRALARAITVVEAGGEAAQNLVKLVYQRSGKAHLIGVTGSPGVGKSTLVDALVTQMRNADKKVAVLAIDPSSPFTGGAILGDRIRMQDHTLDPNVYIRSMANRGHTGGVAMATYDAVRMLEAFGFDVVIIETVGVGQSELAIASTADTTILVLMPGSGDDIQAIKSGIMEIGDIFVVNKGDLPGANKSATEIIASLELAKLPTNWHPPVLVAVSENGEGVDKIWQAVQDHRQFLTESDMISKRRLTKIKAELSEIVAEIARGKLEQSMKDSASVQELLTDIVDLKLDPRTAAASILSSLNGNAEKAGSKTK
ncbi:MAG: methylmalonyl Co-A mutase-associated GTPase MeaB [Cyanobacteriota/Melainabacteria group bacterium]|nr:methylmalonyl Co-A mutase-associated GTPase MeaB [Candidatus Obscuribacterales bacterium]